MQTVNYRKRAFMRAILSNKKELYNIALDPDEEDDLAKKAGRKSAELSELLESYKASLVKPTRNGGEDG
mgnify:CR=1 FL=1